MGLPQSRLHTTVVEALPPINIVPLKDSRRLIELPREALARGAAGARRLNYRLWRQC